jgi:pimeloyl-ACP methyl ester carboxylesterase
LYSTEILTEPEEKQAAFAQPANGRIALPPVFDRSGAVAGPSWRAFAGEWHSALRHRCRFRSRPVSGIDMLPRGDGHPVIVVPGFLRSDGRTRALREVLSRLGYAVVGWGAGINCGPTATALAALDRLLDGSTARFGRRASLVGDSLGGVLARGIAARYPERVRQVITICSPFRLPTASPLAPIYSALSRWHSPDAADWRLWLGAPPPVPTTAIYTKRDGVVAWATCIDEPSADPPRENVEIDALHAAMLGHPQAVRVIAERLARPDPLTAIVPGRAASGR